MRIKPSILFSLLKTRARMLFDVLGILPIIRRCIITKRAERTERGREGLSPNGSSAVPSKCIDIWGPDCSIQVTQGRYQAPISFPSPPSLLSL